MIEDESYDLWQEDAITLNPYLGTDGIAPFIKPCNEKDKGLFILVKTSNKSSGELQDRLIEGELLYCHTADLVAKWGAESDGTKRLQPGWRRCRSHLQRTGHRS